MCRNLDMSQLKGVIFDYACGLDPYLLPVILTVKPPKRQFLSREPRKFEYLRILVDGAHWQGQKK